MLSVLFLKNYSSKCTFLYIHQGQECAFKCARVRNMKKEAFHFRYTYSDHGPV